MTDPSLVQLPERLALTVAEAAAAIGVSERHLRAMLPEIPHCYVGRRVVVPVDALREWLRNRASVGQGQVDAMVEDVLASLDT